ncbi:hypothetical protein [Neobacillus cucumis]|uniref:Uncharacterized protein n=1 Tax=Neobacillus cucumis TaxID=1740721 RepID=A0A2N5HIJ0_9BACI|nr:hypothetical protein [Neobacillus cucumis]PLS05329.1 hypothetical protein CVD27_10030 [Neobacillus cucumis]
MTNNQNKKAAEEANLSLAEKFKDLDARASAEVSSDSEEANQKIQEQFYGEEESNSLLPFHVDVNNPPLKK